MLTDEDLDISKEDFEEPLELSINVDCSNSGELIDDKSNDDSQEEIPDEIDF